MNRKKTFRSLLLNKNFDLDKFIRDSLKEDVGDGDHTSLACIDKKDQGRAVLLVKSNGIIAGVTLADKIFSTVDPSLVLWKYAEDGAPVSKGDIVFTVSGKQQSILKAERLVLNCMQRLSGIATTTAALKEACKGTKAKILDTRKTTPGLRALEKWAVTVGGGYNHRFGLYDMILIKDNHIDYAGGAPNALLKTRKYLSDKKLKLKIEIEARSLAEVRIILASGKVDRILLDNFSPNRIKEAVQIIAGKAETEASGSITLKNIGKYAQSGVDYISVGSLTHSVKSIDLSLKAVK